MACLLCDPYFHMQKGGFESNWTAVVFPAIFGITLRFGLPLVLNPILFIFINVMEIQKNREDAQLEEKD